MKPLSFIPLTCVLSLIGCTEIARIAFLPDVTAAQFAQIGNDVCVTPTSTGQDGLAAYPAALEDSEDRFFVRSAERSIIAAHADRDVVIQVREAADGGVTCVIGAALTDAHLAIAETAGTFPPNGTLQNMDRLSVTSVQWGSAASGRNLVFTLLPEGKVVLSRTDLELGQANDYRYTTLVVETL